MTFEKVGSALLVQFYWVCWIHLLDYQYYRIPHSGTSVIIGQYSFTKEY